MAPITRTAEYNLLTELRDHVSVQVDRLNRLALDKAISDGYVGIDGNEFAYITDAGYDRLDEIEDGK
jgi:hypothetical protein